MTYEEYLNQKEELEAALAQLHQQYMAELSDLEVAP